MKDSLAITVCETVITPPPQNSSSFPKPIKQRLTERLSAFLTLFQSLWRRISQFFCFLINTRRRRPIILKHEPVEIDLRNRQLQRKAEKLSPDQFQISMARNNMEVQIMLDWCVKEFYLIKKSKGLTKEDVVSRCDQIKMVLSMINNSLLLSTAKNTQPNNDNDKTTQFYIQFKEFFERCEPILRSRAKKSCLSRCGSTCKSFFRPITGIICLLLLPLLIVCAIPLCFAKINLLYTLDAFSRNTDYIIHQDKTSTQTKCLICCCASQLCPEDQNVQCDCSCLPGCGAHQISGNLNCCDYCKGMCCWPISSVSRSSTPCYDQSNGQKTRSMSNGSLEEANLTCCNSLENNITVNSEENDELSSKIQQTPKEACTCRCEMSSQDIKDT